MAKFFPKTLQAFIPSKRSCDKISITSKWPTTHLEVKLKPCVSGTYHGCQTSTLRRKLHMITSTTIRNLQSITLPWLTFNKTNNGFFLLWTETGCADRREKEATGTEASTSQPVAPRYTTRGRSYGRRGLSS